MKWRVIAFVFAVALCSFAVQSVSWAPAANRFMGDILLGVGFGMTIRKVCG